MEVWVRGWMVGPIGRLDEWEGEGVGLTTAGYNRIQHAIPECSKIPLKICLIEI